jgi:O-antigen biosynthesis protein
VTGSTFGLVSAAGKFLWADGRKLYVRGVTYGTFRSDAEGRELHDPEVVERDFETMAANGVNAVRTYTVPDTWLLDAAQRHGLRVNVGIPWESHVAFLNDARLARRIVGRVRSGVRSCAGHPALLCFTIGNEIPSAVARWHGRRRTERFLERLYWAAKAEDPGTLVTYASFPTTEYLSLPFLDFLSFNVYLERRERFDAYLARLHNLAGDRPLVMGELGVESRGNGENAQARLLDWQVRAAFAAGSAGTFVFSWTDEWWRGGHEVGDWDFGLTDRQRKPKPALAAVKQAFADVPFPPDIAWPRISVVVCTHNGQRTLRGCLDGIGRLEYPDYEVIVVDDGSTDGTRRIAEAHGVRIIVTENQGLSEARNVGLAAATGGIVAFTDDDARPDPHWLTYLASVFLRTEYAGLGGPNIPPHDDGLVAGCVANAPGGAIHVLFSDTDAEHIPGCNMAFRKSALEAIGGFDAQFRAAGDDVDICWRLQEAGFRLGFVPGAFVWHHRRSSVAAYWRQQRGYGKAEALLERKWPEKYNTAGHVTWAGRLYGHRLLDALTRRRGRVYHGTWGNGLFQSLYHPPTSPLWSIPLMPEWYLAVLALAGVSALGLLWAKLLLTVPLLAVAAGIPVVQATLAARESRFPGLLSRRPWGLWPRQALTAYLHLLQPAARLYGRLRYGLSPWRLGRGAGLALPVPRGLAIWTGRWQAELERLAGIETMLRAHRAIVQRGGESDRLDLSVRGGALGAARVLMCAEEHGNGIQCLRFRIWPHFSLVGSAAVVGFAAVSGQAALQSEWTVTAVLLAAALLLALRMIQESGGATAMILEALRAVEREWTAPAEGAVTQEEAPAGSNHA